MFFISILRQIRLSLLFVVCVFAEFASADEGLRSVDYYINHNSLEPFYDNHSIDSGVLLHIREVVAEGRERSVGKDGKVILLVHGSTFPATVAFDLDFPGASLMQSMALAGWDVFAVDLEGYGESSRPPSMEYPALFPDDPAPVGPAVSLADVHRTVEFIKNLRLVERVHLLGWSAGAMNEVPSYAINYPDNITGIVLMGTSWRGWPATEDENHKENLDAAASKVDLSYPANAPVRWQRLGTDISKLPQGMIESYIAAHQASDPAAGVQGGAVRKPSGRMVQSTEDSPHFDASLIKVPTLILRGENDPIASLDDNQALLDALGADIKKLVTIQGVGHFNHFENNRDESIKAIFEFLEQ